MAEDEELVRRKAREASASARHGLDQARSQLTAARKPFNTAPGSFPVRLIGKRTGKQDSHITPYRELLEALTAVESAIAHAEAAWDAVRAVPKL